MIYCPTCKAQNEDGAAFCDQCGGKLAGAAAVPVAPAYPAAVSYNPVPAAKASVASSTVCPSCGAAVIPGEAFCDACGAALSSMAPVAAGPYTPAPGGYTPVTPVAPYPGAPHQPVAPAMAGRLIAAAGQTFTLAGKSVYLVGREDAVSGILPDVDTSDGDGLGAGVGRRHAEISVQGVQWFVKDLNSVNGTWVNNVRLAPNASQPINAGDQIRLGKWIATFQI